MQNRILSFSSFGPPSQHLTLETQPLCPPDVTKLRVAMIYSPINPSDVIPVTGAYSHLIQLPCVAGYEGVGRVISAPESHADLVGRRVLPLRGAGTWQAYVDCDAGLAVAVPDEIEDLVAARAYINPLAALTMLDTWPVKGKSVLLSGAGSSCAEYLGQWALENGATEVAGIYRSESRVDRLRALGITPVVMNDIEAVRRAADRSEVTFDSLGGPVASVVLEAMREGSDFVGYGLLSGQSVVTPPLLRARYHRFHMRDSIADMSVRTWQSQFTRLWPKLARVQMPSVELFALENWREALALTERSGGDKPVLSFL